MALPRPDSKELRALIGRRQLGTAIYAVLYESRDDPPNIAQVRQRVGTRLAQSEEELGDQANFSRRLRELDPFFLIERTRRGSETLYRLVRQKPKRSDQGKPISKTLRSWVLRDQRCAQCGRTPVEDGVKLHVDHILPKDWGGTDEQENLQALCRECNEGKKNYFASLGADMSADLRKAATYDEVHRRIGEALKAAYPDAVRTDVLDRIANAKEFQDDWHKRARELRFLGWKWSFERRKTDGRTIVEYRLDEWPPDWPKGKISAELKRIAAARAAQKKSGA